MKRANVGPLPGVTQDIAGFKVVLINHMSSYNDEFLTICASSICRLLINLAYMF